MITTNKARILVPLLLAAVLAVIVGVWWGNRRVAADSTQLTLHGNVDIREVDLAFNGSERIDQMRVQEGDRVRKDEVLASLDKQRLQHSVALAAAQAAAQRQVVARLEAGSRPEEIRQAQAAADAAHVEAANAERTRARMDELARQKLVPQEQTDNARAAAEAATAQARAADESLRLATLGPRKEDIAAAHATLRAAEAQLALTQRQLDDADLKSPADGVIEQRLLEPGDMASPQRPAYTLALTEPLWVRAYVGEPDLGKLRLGMRAEVLTDSFPGQRYEAWVGFIAATAEFTPKSVETKEVRTDLVYQVRIFVCDPKNQLRLGMPATAVIPLNQPQGATANHGCGAR